MKTRPFLLHALSPLHVGTGHSADIIDLPIAKMKATGIPFVPGSAIKGVLRDARRDGDQAKAEAVFGPQSADADSHAGALIVSDARLIAMPVRSFRGTFCWISSPLLLVLAQRDVKELAQLKVPDIEGRRALVSTEPENICVHKNSLYLQDIDLPVAKSADITEWAKTLARCLSFGANTFSKRFALVDDDTMSLFCETATQVDTRVRINANTRTVDKGALWLEESLPPETMLVGLLGGDRSRKTGQDMSPSDVLDYALPEEQVLQFGGKATVGRGRCRIVPVV